MPKLAAQVISTDDELSITWRYVSWEHAGKCGQFRTTLDSSCQEADVTSYFERRVETEERLACQKM